MSKVCANSSRRSHGSFEIAEVRVETVSPRKEIDRRVLTADFRESERVGLIPVRGLCSARRPNNMPPCGLRLGLVGGFSKDEVPTGSVGKVGHDENGLGEENCDSSSVPRNMR